MKIENIMHRDVQLIGPESTVREAAQMMRTIDATVLPVAENDRLVGIVTDRDIAVRAVAEAKGPETIVRDIMSPEVKYCFDDEDVGHVADTMAELQVRRLPVVNREKRLVGIVSLSDFAAEGPAAKTAKTLRGGSQPGRQESDREHGPLPFEQPAEGFHRPNPTGPARTKKG